MSHVNINEKSNISSNSLVSKNHSTYIQNQNVDVMQNSTCKKKPIYIDQFGGEFFYFNPVTFTVDQQAKINTRICPPKIEAILKELRASCNFDVAESAKPSELLGNQAMMATAQLREINYFQALLRGESAATATWQNVIALPRDELKRNMIKEGAMNKYEMSQALENAKLVMVCHTCCTVLKSPSSSKFQILKKLVNICIGTKHTVLIRCIGAQLK